MSTFTTSLKRSIELKHAGYLQKSQFYWVEEPVTDGVRRWYRTVNTPVAKHEIDEYDRGYRIIASAYLASELVKMMLKSIDIKRSHYWLQIEVQEMQEGWSCQYKNSYRCYKFFEAKEMADAIADMALYLKREGLL